jgi:5'-deoxynucleotidase YfbR-like HD superfamily hydrolase
MHSQIDFTDFPPTREEILKTIMRYSMFDAMYYRTSVWTHAHRVLGLLEEILPIVGQHFPSFDPEKARVLALIHDDAEIITGDIQAGHKSRMTPEQLAQVALNEETAVEQLAERYPKTIHGYNYKELLQHAARKDCIEAIIVSYVDKVDGYCESMHEVLAGNLSFTRAVIFYVDIFANFPIKHPELKDFLKSKDSPIINIKDRIPLLEVKGNRFASFGKPHTEESLKFETDFPFYNTWKKFI